MISSRMESNEWMLFWMITLVDNHDVFYDTYNNNALAAEAVSASAEPLDLLARGLEHA